MRAEKEKQRNAYRLNKRQGNSEKAILTEQSIAILDQLTNRQSFVWFSIPQDEHKSIEILPTCHHNAGEIDKLNKFSQPFTFKDKKIPVIEDKPPIMNNQSIRFRPGLIHVAAAKVLGISDDGIGTGETFAGGGLPGLVFLQHSYDWIIRFRSTSHNAWASTPHPLYIHYCTNFFSDYKTTTDKIKRAIPYKEARLIGEAFQSHPHIKIKVEIDLEKEQIEFEQMSDEELKKNLQKKFVLYIAQGQHNLIKILQRDCKDEKITLNLNEVMFDAIESNSMLTIQWLMKNGAIDYNFKHPIFGTFLDYAINLKKDAIANLLLKKADLNNLKDYNQALFFVLRQNPLPDEKLVQSILEHKVLNLTIRQSLLSATKNGDLRLVKLLLPYSYGKSMADSLTEIISNKISLFQKRNVIRLINNTQLTQDKIESDLWKAAISTLEETSSVIKFEKNLDKICLKLEEMYFKQTSIIQRIRINIPMFSKGSPSTGSRSDNSKKVVSFTKI